MSFDGEMPLASKFLPDDMGAIVTALQPMLL